MATDKDVVNYFKTKRSFSDYGIWFNLIETRMSLGLVYLDKDVKVGNKYLYFITRVLKNGQVESVGISMVKGASNGNHLLSEYKPYVYNKQSKDSALMISWKVPVDQVKIDAIKATKSKQKDFLPIPFGKLNVRGAVYLQTNLGWEKTDLILPTSNNTNDTLTFSYVASATNEKYYKLFLQIEDEVHNKGLESDTTTIFVIDKEKLPFINRVVVKDTINGVRLSWKPLPMKSYIEKISISRSELNSPPTIFYLKPTDTSYTDYQITVGKTYVYKVSTVFLPQTNLKQEFPAEGVGTFTVFNKPLTPTNLIAKHTGKNITLQWDSDSIPGFYGFYVYRGISYNDLNLISAPIREHKYVDSSDVLSGKSTYFYAVVAQNLRQQTSGFSNRVEIMPKRKYFIFKPASLRFYYANHTLSIKWDDVTTQDPQVVGYILQRKLSTDKEFISFPSLNTNTLSYIDTSINVGLTYQYRIASITIKGDTSDFTEVYEYGLKKPNVAILTDYTVRDITDGIEIAIPTLIYENRTAYNIYRKEPNEVKFQKIASIKADNFIYIDKKVASNKYYLYAISVVENDGREGVLSDAKSVKRD
ncbi:MAG: hypothetical protein ACR2IM_02835 [Sediminibacterium sp.]